MSLTGASGTPGKVAARRAVLFVVVLLAVAALGAIRDNHIVTDITWARPLPANFRLAGENGKGVLLFFDRPGSGWCAKMDVETLVDRRVVNLSRAFVCLRAETDIDPQIAKRYHVRVFPTILVIDPGGKQLARFEGYTAADRLAEALDAAITGRP